MDMHIKYGVIFHII